MQSDQQMYQMLKSINFWGGVSSFEKEHSKTANWLKELKEETGSKHHVQEEWVITVDKIIKQCRKMPNCKSPGKTSSGILDKKYDQPS